MLRELAQRHIIFQRLTTRRVQMYKKRLRSWGMSKNVKAQEKEKAMVTFLYNSEDVTGSSNVRYDKLVRYAKSHSKRRTSSSHTLNQFIRDRTRFSLEGSMIDPFLAEILNTSSSNRSRRGSESLPPSLALPDENAQLDLFLRSMQSIIEKERQEWLSGQQNSPDVILAALARGMKLWHKNDFEAARLAFGRASRIVSQDLQGSIFVSRIAYCISSLVWRPKREAVFQNFAEYMAKAALEILGHACPLTIVLQHLQTEQSIDTQLAIWACALDEYHITGQNVEHWWGMAKRRWRWCQSCGKLDLAEQYCTHALREARRIGKLSESMKSEALQDLRLLDVERYRAKALPVLQDIDTVEFNVTDQQSPPGTDDLKTINASMS